ncbi:RNase HII [Bifidobacterium bohemicum]|nr:RNase HII [Bifidobacterium bohemicum]
MCSLQYPGRNIREWCGCAEDVVPQVNRKFSASQRDSADLAGQRNRLDSSNPMSPAGLAGAANPVRRAGLTDSARQTNPSDRDHRMDGVSERKHARRVAHSWPTLELEARIAADGFDLVVGFDEVGRGALAGPVMVGAAALWAKDIPDLQVPQGLTDSKLLTESKREVMFEPLRSWCCASAVGQASNVEIDDWGISYALGIAALRALNELERELGVGVSAVDGGSTDDGRIRVPHQASTDPTGAVCVGAILDGPNDYITKALNTFEAPQVPVPANITTKVKADQSCALVSAASVIAKVTRDRFIVGLAQGNAQYAPYGWVRNKGYGSAAHRAAIAKYGPTALHRLSWHLT